MQDKGRERVWVKLGEGEIDVKREVEGGSDGGIKRGRERGENNAVG